MVRTRALLKGLLAFGLAAALAVPAVAAAATRFTTRTVRLELQTRYGTPPSTHHWYRIRVAVPVGHRAFARQGTLNIPRSGNAAGLLYELLPYRSVASYCAGSSGHAVGVGHGVSFCAGTTSSIGRFAKELPHNITFVVLIGPDFLDNDAVEHIVASASLR